MTIEKYTSRRFHPLTLPLHSHIAVKWAPEKPLQSWDPEGTEFAVVMMHMRELEYTAARWISGCWRTLVNFKGLFGIQKAKAAKTNSVLNVAAVAVERALHSASSRLTRVTLKHYEAIRRWGTYYGLSPSKYVGPSMTHCLLFKTGTPARERL